MQKKLVFKNPANPLLVSKLAEDLNVPITIAGILAQRGITDKQSAQAFLYPQLNAAHDPFLMKGMDEAVRRIEHAISNQENILIYGDYDVDGTTAVGMMTHYLTRNYDLVHSYIPDRYKEGYGISDAGIDFALDNNFSLVIALDCGIKAVRKIRRAKENGIDFIVCDHHTPDEMLPEAIVLNPKQKDCTYPYKELSGCGIGFKLIQALSKKRGENSTAILDLLDLVVISIAADIVPITGENRILAAAGLERLNLGTLRPGIQKILDKAGKKIPLNIEDIVFGIAPRINAAGRIESGNRAVELLLTNDLVSAERIALLIDDHNTTRKNLDAKITSEALEQIRCDLSLDGDQPRRTTVLYHPEWHKGVVGIVASRLMESYYRPTIVLTESNGKVVGSARSVRGFNVYEAIEKCSDLLEQFGGHFYAAGLTLTHENVKAFQQKFEEIVSQSITDDQLQPQINVDAELEFSEIFQGSKSAVPEFFKFLKMLSPFGPDNMNPVFISKNVYDTGYATVLKEKHLKMSLVQESNPKIIMSAIAFGMADRYEEIKGKPFDVVYSIEENNWNGRTSLQLMVKEIVV